MALVVQKFGGTSMGGIERIKNVANRVICEIKNGNQVIVVVSAMSGVTDSLINLFKDACGNDFAINDDLMPEYDSIISTGEQVSSGLLAAVLTSMGYKARSFLGWQIPFETSGFHSKAQIEQVDGKKLLEALSVGYIPIVSGFQGFSTQTGRQTTLGRGGSDTSAVAIAAATNADICDIYTDVDGVFSADPRIVKVARRLDFVGYEEVLEMASSGAKVLEPRSVILAMNYNVKTRVLSTFESNGGTILTNDENIMEQRKISNVTSNTKEVQIVVCGLSDKPGTSAKLFGLISANNIQVDVIAQSSGRENGLADIAFTINQTDLPLFEKIVNENKSLLEYSSLIVNKNVAKISVIGTGMRSNAGIASKVFSTLAENNINILTISTSEIKITVLIPSDLCELAVRKLHSAFELDV